MVELLLIGFEFDHLPLGLLRLVLYVPQNISPNNSLLPSHKFVQLEQYSLGSQYPRTPQDMCAEQ